MSLLNPVFAIENVRYRDGKRYAWFVSILVPAVLGCGPLFYALTGRVASLWLPAVLVYGSIPLLDVILGEDRSNPPEEVVPLLDRLLDREGEYPGLSEMAKALHMSERTLNRKLKAQGTSYQMLLDDVRQELAVWYLRQSEMPVEAIAERLGYRDTSNFSRTCKRWLGVTPREIRGG